MKTLDSAHRILVVLAKSLCARTLHINGHVYPGFTVHNVGSHRKKTERKRNGCSLGVTPSPDLWGQRDPVEAPAWKPECGSHHSTAGEHSTLGMQRDWWASFGGGSQGVKIYFHTQASYPASSCTNGDSKYCPGSQ